MKKLIFIVTLLFAFTLNVNAQDTKLTTAQENAKKEAAMLAHTVGLDESQTRDYYQLFEMKYNTLEDKELSAERKKEFLHIVMMKIQAGLSEKQMKLLEADTALLDRIKNGVKTK